MAKVYKFKVNVPSAKTYTEPVKKIANEAGNVYSGTVLQCKAVKDKENWYQITLAGNYARNGKYIYKTKKNLIDMNEDTTTPSEDTPSQDEGGNTAQTTEAVTDENGDVVNTDEDGNTSTFSVEASAALDTFSHIADSFLYEVGPSVKADQYMQTLNNSNGIQISNLYGIFGIPLQFTPDTDPRVIDDTSKVGANKYLGRCYANKIIRNMPLLFITPGVPVFMAGFSEDQKNGVLKELKETLEDAAESLLGRLGDDASGKYYSLKFDYKGYYDYVNAMLRSAAMMLGIGDKKLLGKSLKNLHWLYSKHTDDSSEIYSRESTGSILGPYAGCVPFYADMGSTSEDSFSNETGESQISSMVNSLSDKTRELNFIIGNVGGVLGMDAQAFTLGNIFDNLSTVIKGVGSVLPFNNIVSSVLNKTSTILTGGRLVFPEIWTNSTFGRQYSGRLKLVTQSGDKFAYYINILVPLYHMLALTLPRDSGTQAYISPFLLRCYYKGMFNIDMGIMESLSVSKGAEGEWTSYGLPTVVEISFSIKDLYQQMYMSKAGDDDRNDMDIFSNISELDYISNTCGININDQEIVRMFTLWKVLKLDNWTGDMIGGLGASISQYFNTKISNLLGVF